MAALEAIATTRLADTASYIELTSIPSTYEHLTLTYSLQGETNNNRAAFYLVLNGDTGSNYVWYRMQIYGSSMAAGGWSGMTVGLDGTMGTPAGGASNARPTNVFAVGTADIMDYANTNKGTSVMFQCWAEEAGSVPLSTGEYFFEGNVWTGQTAVNSLKIYNSSYTLARESTVTLYGWND